MKKNLLLLIVVALLGSESGGCSYVTKSGRQQAAYARYVRRSSYARVRMQRKLSPSPKVQPIQAPPEVTTGSGPESVTASSDSE